MSPPAPGERTPRPDRTEPDDPADAFLRWERDTEGALMLRFLDGPDYHEFDAWGVDLARRAGGRIEETLDGPEDRLWRIGVGGESLTLLLSARHGTFVVAYEASAEPALQRLGEALRSAARRIAAPGPGDPGD